MKKVATNAQKRNLIFLFLNCPPIVGGTDNGTSVISLNLPVYKKEGLTEEQKKDYRQYKHILDHLGFEEQERKDIPEVPVYQQRFVKEFPLTPVEANRLIMAVHSGDDAKIEKQFNFLNEKIDKCEKIHA
jgi:hypothetical protein